MRGNHSIPMVKTPDLGFPDKDHTWVSFIFPTLGTVISVLGIKLLSTMERTMCVMSAEGKRSKHPAL